MYTHKSTNNSRSCLNINSNSCLLTCFQLHAHNWISCGVFIMIKWKTSLIRNLDTSNKFLDPKLFQLTRFDCIYIQYWTSYILNTDALTCLMQSMTEHYMYKMGTWNKILWNIDHITWNEFAFVELCEPFYFCEDDVAVSERLLGFYSSEKLWQRATFPLLSLLLNGFARWYCYLSTYIVEVSSKT